MRKKGNKSLSFWGSICKRIRSLREDRRMDDIGSMPIFSSRVSMNFLRSFIIEIFTTPKRKILMRTFRLNERKKQLPYNLNLAISHLKIEMSERNLRDAFDLF
jgi:hypothetical protein